MKSMKKVLASVLALAMVVTAVPVTNANAATAPKLSSTKVALWAGGQSKTTKVTTPSTWKSVKVTAKSSNTKVAKVKTSNSKKLVRVLPVKAGSAKVTVKVTAKKAGKKVSKTLSAKVTVKPVVIKAKTKAMTLAVDETAKLDLAIAPKGKKVNYKSSNEAVVKVTSDGAIQATGLGTATVTVSSKYANANATIDVTVVKEGAVATLTNPISEKYQNSVLVNSQAVINVKVVSNGKPAANETVVFTTTGVSGPAGHYEVKGNNSAVTNANGIATFVVGNKYDVKANDKNEVAGLKYTATVASSGVKVSGELGFAAISISDIDNLNNNAVRPNGVNPLAVSTNDSGNGTTITTSMATQNNSGTVTIGSDIEYVDSQQVSSIGGTEHQVAFQGGVPMITLPTTSSDLSVGKDFVQPIDKTTTKYDTYANDSEYITLEVAPNELTYATLNFSKVQLSKYTALEIATYKNEADAKADRGALNKTTIEGETVQNNFSYQIPLNTKYAGLCVKVTLKSKGQVDTNNNTGYSIKNITGVYKTETTNNGSTVVLDGAKVTWKAISAPMSEMKVLTGGAIEAIKNVSKVDLSGYANVTYQVPVFPYTGNAVITCYDKNNEVKAYYVCPTVNGYDTVDPVSKDVNHVYNNVNYLDLSADFVYKVSKEEAFNEVGTVSQIGNDVYVNSEKVGHTTVEGTLTVEGSKIEGLDATNSKIYTSVQWCPLPTVETIDKDGFLALVGQNITVTAQLTDKNGNPVSTSGETVEFEVNTETVKSKGKLSNADNKKISVVDVVSTTDANGQGKLVLKAAEVATALDVNATCKNSKYKVVLKISDKQTKLADLYWVEANLAFTDSVQTSYVQNPKTISTAEKDIMTTSGAAIEPKTGTNWAYAMYVTGTKLSGGVFDGRNVTINKGLNINMSKTADSVGTINVATGVNGMATATSSKIGQSKIIGTLTSASVTPDIEFTVEKVAEPLKNAGSGTTNLAKKLTIIVNWVANGMNAIMEAANGSVVATTGTSIQATVYTRVVDGNGNALKDVEVTFDASGDNAALAGVKVKTDANGIAKTVVTFNGTAANGGKSIVTATVAGVTGTFTKIINWYPVDADYKFELNVDKNLEETLYNSRVDGDKVILTFSDNVIASSVVAQQFKVSYDGRRYEVSEAVVDGNVITLTVKNGPKDVAIDTPFEVAVETATVKGVDYTITSEQGVTIDNVTFSVYTGTVVAPVQK